MDCVRVSLDGSVEGERGGSRFELGVKRRRLGGAKGERTEEKRVHRLVGGEHRNWLIVLPNSDT